jgi:hypothetical protein
VAAGQRAPRTLHASLARHTTTHHTTTTHPTTTRLLRLGGADPLAARDVRRAVLLVSSVKTLPVAVTVLGGLAGLLGEATVGAAVVPCVLAHLGQILWDSLMVARMVDGDARQAAQQQLGSKGGT